MVQSASKANTGMLNQLALPKFSSNANNAQNIQKSGMKKLLLRNKSAQGLGLNESMNMSERSAGKKIVLKLKNKPPPATNSMLR